MSRTSNLYRLQEVDLELDRIKGRLDEIKAILSESQELDQARIELEESLAHLKEAEAESRSAERFVASQRSKIEETDSKLYGGSITSPKELEDLQLEAMSLRRHLGTLEDRLLEAMMRHEEAEKEQEAAAERHERAEQSQAQRDQTLSEEMRRLISRHERLEKEREAALASVPDDDLEEYLRLRDKLAGIAVALLEDGSCSACGLTHPASVQQTIRGGTELVPCSQCGRILYGG